MYLLSDGERLLAGFGRERDVRGVIPSPLFFGRLFFCDSVGRAALGEVPLLKRAAFDDSCRAAVKKEKSRCRKNSRKEEEEKKKRGGNSGLREPKPFCELQVSPSFCRYEFIKP